MPDSWSVRGVVPVCNQQYGERAMDRSGGPKEGDPTVRSAKLMIAGFRVRDWGQPGTSGSSSWRVRCR